MTTRYDIGRDSVNVTTGAFSQRDTSGRHVRRGKSRGRERRRFRFVLILTGRSRGVFTRSPWEDTAGFPAPQAPREDAEEGEHKKREERSRAERRRKREDFLRSRDVSNANLSLLSDDLDDPNPSPFAKHLQRYDQARVAAGERSRGEASREAFQGTWLRSTEKDLRGCCERYQASDDSSESSTLKAYIHTYRQTQGPSRDSGDVWNCQGSVDRQPHPSARSDRTPTPEASKRNRSSSSQRVTKKHC